MKYRKKNPILPHQAGIAHFEISDEEYYPYTSAKAIKASDLVITLFSCAAAEAAYAGVPVINLTPNDLGLFYDDQYLLSYLQGHKERAKSERACFYNNDPTGLFNTPGVVYSFEIRSFSKRIEKLKLKDFPIDQEIGNRFIKRLIKGHKGSASENILNTIEASL